MLRVSKYVQISSNKSDCEPNVNPHSLHPSLHNTWACVYISVWGFKTRLQWRQHIQLCKCLTHRSSEVLFIHFIHHELLSEDNRVGLEREVKKLSWETASTRTSVWQRHSFLWRPVTQAFISCPSVYLPPSVHRSYSNFTHFHSSHDRLQTIMEEQEGRQVDSDVLPVPPFLSVFLSLITCPSL